MLCTLPWFIPNQTFFRVSPLICSNTFFLFQFTYPCCATAYCNHDVIPVPAGPKPPPTGNDKPIRCHVCMGSGLDYSEANERCMNFANVKECRPSESCSIVQTLKLGKYKVERGCAKECNSCPATDRKMMIISTCKVCYWMGIHYNHGNFTVICCYNTILLPFGEFVSEILFGK